MPSQPKGYDRSKTWVSSAGIAVRATPQKPSHPTTYSHSSTSSRPSCRNRTRGLAAVGALDGERLRLEEQRAALRQLEGDEVLADLGLRVHHHGPAVGEGGEVDAVALPVVAQLDAVVAQALAVHACAGPGRAQHVDGALLQDPGPLPVLHVLPVAALQDDRVDTGVVEQPGEQEPGGAGSDDADGGTHRSFPSCGSVAGAFAQLPSCSRGEIFFTNSL